MSDSAKTLISPRDYVIRVALILSESTIGEELNPSIWRRVKLSAHLKLNVLHDKVLAPLMGWTRNYHTYTFTRGTKKWLCENTSAPDLMHSRGFGKVLDPANATLKDLLKNVGDVCLYTYDLGDGWYHKIELEETISTNESNGACQVLNGAMRCPDEDGEGCHTYQTGVLNLLLLKRAQPHNHIVARELASTCFERHNALNVRGSFVPDEFSVQDTQEAITKAFASRTSSMTGTKQFSSPDSAFGGFCPTHAGQRVLKRQVEDDRGGDGYHLSMKETINLKPDNKDHAACICGNPLNLSVCSGCKMVYYCSVECQRKHWKSKESDSHKVMCPKEKATRIVCEKEAKDWRNSKPDKLEIEGERIPLVKARKKLRFKVGDIVDCSVGDGLWAEGVIIATHYREDHWPPSRPSAPYQIELAGDVARYGASDVPPDSERVPNQIYAVWDDDSQIRKLPEDMKLSSRLAKLQMDILD